MKKECFVITNTEYGWDCVIAVYMATSEKEVAETFIIENEGDLEGVDDALEWMDDRSYVIHEVTIKNIL